jgi:hypothetical protein
VFVSPGTRFDASDEKATNRPFALITGKELLPLAGAATGAPVFGTLRACASTPAHTRATSPIAAPEVIHVEEKPVFLHPRMLQSCTRRLTPGSPTAHLSQPTISELKVGLPFDD